MTIDQINQSINLIISLIAILLSTGATIYTFRKNKEIESIKASLATKVYITKNKYDLELEIYKGIWEKVIEIRAILTDLVPLEDFDSNSQEDRNWYLDTGRPLNLMIGEMEKTIDKNEPFYSPSVYKNLKNVKIFLENRALEFGSIIFQEGYKIFDDEATGFFEQLDKAISETSESIRNRLNNIEIL